MPRYVLSIVYQSKLIIKNYHLKRIDDCSNCNPARRFWLWFGTSSLVEERVNVRRIHKTITPNYVAGNYPSYTQGKISRIALILTHIRLYLPFSDWFGIKLTSFCFKINRKIVNTIWYRFELTRFEKVFSVYTDQSGIPGRSGVPLGIMEMSHWNPSEQHRSMVLMGSRGALSKTPIMPRGVKLSNNRCYFAQSAVLQHTEIPSYDTGTI